MGCVGSAFAGSAATGSVGAATGASTTIGSGAGGTTGATRFFGAAFFATTFFGAAFLGAAFLAATFLTAFFGAAFLAATFFTAFLGAPFFTAFLAAFLGAAFFAARFGVPDDFTLRFFAICASFNTDEWYGPLAGAIITQVAKSSSCFSTSGTVVRPRRSRPARWLRLCYSARTPMLRELRSDRLLQASVAAYCLFVGAHLLLPLKGRELLAESADPVLLALSIAASVHAARRSAAPVERRFWWMLTGVSGLWSVITVLHLVPTPASFDTLVSVAEDCLYLTAYGVAVLAIESKPHVVVPPGQDSWSSAVEWMGGGVLGAGLLAYFIIIPSRVDPQAYSTYVSSMSLFVLLDIGIIARLCWLARAESSERWRVAFSILATAFIVSLVNDTAELVAYVHNGDLETGGLWDIAWVTQFPFYTAAAVAGLRLRGGAVSGDLEVASGRRFVSPLVPYTFLLPAVDLAGRLAGVLDPHFDHYRAVVVLSCMLVLGGLAVYSHAQQERQHRRVRRELQAVQAELLRSRKMEALGRLAGGVSHDFNNLLSIIIGYAEMLLERAAPGDRIFEPLDQIKGAAERAVTITRQLTTFSQRQHVEGEPFDFDRALLAREPLLVRLAGPGIRLRIEAGTPGGWTLGDTQQFERLLINLVANSRDAITGGGSIDIRSAWLQIGEDGGGDGSLPSGRYLELTVHDTGCGMSEDVLAHLFEPFFTTKPRGQTRGLGLAVVYGIVRQAGGHIEVASDVGHGTTVRVLFPATAPPVVRVAEEASTAAAALVPDETTILLAEDERGLRRLMRACLERAGYRVLEAADGRAAFELAAQHEGRIDLLLTDVIMPGMNGRELAERLEVERPEMRVLFVSGYSADMLKDLKLPNAGVAFLQKPFSLDTLLTRARQVLEPAEHATTIAGAL